MKRKLPVMILCALACILYAAAVGGTESDPLISMSYLNGTFTSAVDSRVETKLDLSDEMLRAMAEDELNASSDSNDGWTETRLKEADTITCGTGVSFLLLAGEATVQCGTGTVIDVTVGDEVTSGSHLSVRHRYLSAEDTNAVFTVISNTAVVETMGGGEFTYSNFVDYNAIAAALKQLHLFQGSTTGYGQGYDLEDAPTRLQAMIMFIRAMGEEEEALAWTGSHPFTDVESGTLSEKYLGYAYERGYTNGYSATTYRPGQKITANQYMEFMLRALGHSSMENTYVADSLERALAVGVISNREYSLLKSATFLRAQLVYVSYFALDAVVVSSGITLQETLQSKGVFTAEELETAEALARSQQLK